MIRILKTSTTYPAYVVRFYAERPGLADAPYATQMAALMADCYGWADHWKRHLESTGRFEVEEVLFDVAPLQRAWAREHGLSAAGEDWQWRVLEAQARAFRPEVWFQHGYFADAARRQAFRNACPSLRLIMSWDGVRRDDGRFFEGVDYMLTCHPGSLDYYRANGFHADIFRLRFEDSIPARLRGRSEAEHVAFIGSLHLVGHGHHARADLLWRLAGQLPVAYWLGGDVGWSGLGRAARALIRRGRLGELADLLSRSPAVVGLGRLSRGPVFGLAMYQTLADSAIALNVHIDAAGDVAGNMRLFEATGVGSCLLTEWKDNLRELFEPDEEVVAYRSAAECVDKARQLLADPALRHRIAAAGQARTLRDYTMRSSIEPVGERLVGLLGSRAGAARVAVA